MAGIILTDCKVLVGGYDLSAFHNSINLEYGAEMLDDTVFGTGGTRSNKPGMKTVNLSGNGFWDTAMDKPLYDKIGAVRENITVAPVGNVEGDRIYTTRGVEGTYNPLSGEVGGLLPFDLNFMASNAPLVKGVLLARGSKAATGNSTGVQLGVLGTGQRAYSSLHVTTVNATSIQVIVESDDNAGFSSPTTRLTHTLVTGAGGVVGDWQELAGPVATDNYWRSKWTLVGVGPFVIYHAFGIQ